MNRVNVFSFITTISTIILFLSVSSMNCSNTESKAPSSPEIPGTEKIELKLPAHLGTIATGETFQYTPSAKVTFLALAIGDNSAGAAPLKVVDKSVQNVKYGCTSYIGMGQNSVATTSVKVYNPTNFTFSGTPPAGVYNASWMVLGYDSNFNLVASSPKWDVTVNSW
jgi:hypothetical protein